MKKREHEFEREQRGRRWQGLEVERERGNDVITLYSEKRKII